MRIPHLHWCILVLLFVSAEHVVGRPPLALRRRAEDVPPSSPRPLRAMSTESSSPTRMSTSSGTQSSASPAPDSSQSAQSESSSRLTTESDSSTRSRTSPTSTTASSTTVSVASTAINGHDPSATAAIRPAEPNTLPLKPRITPGLAVAGVILMITGTAYALIGIKNKWLHIPLSAGYLTSLAVTVLIIYVMNPPVSKGIQGAFVVATFITGVIFGALSMIFPEITEGLGCLLGGFCLSMWLLMLRPGGLLTSSGAKGIFIAAFCVGVYALSFSHYTRPYGLIASTSFAGATAVIIGIDCFSRAGLKEFWLYLWALNKDVFPLDTDTYPHTRGIRVELASVIFVVILGLISQLKLWKVVKDRRRQKIAERLKAERDLDEAEEAVGRRIVEDNSRDRMQWEATYGDNPRPYGDQDSGIAVDFESVRKGETSMVNSREVGEADEDGIELSQLDSSKRSLKTKSVTIRVVRDDGTELPTVGEDESAMRSGQSSTEMLGRNASARTSSASPGVSTTVGMRDRDSANTVHDGHRLSLAPAPPIVPLPFTIPVAEDSAEEDDGSSTNTRAASIDAPMEGSEPAGSSSSRKRSLSASAKKHPEVTSASQEALLIPHVDDDDASSLAATIDNMSDIGSSPLLEPSKGLDPIPDAADSPLIKVDEERSSKSVLVKHTQDVSRDSGPRADNDSNVMQTVDSGHHGELKPSTTGPNSNSTIIQPPLKSPFRATGIWEYEPLLIPLPSSSASSQREDNETVEGSEGSDMRSYSARRSRHRASSSPTSSESPKHTANSEPSKKRQRVSLSDQLPKNVSKIVMTYRTNEWAKHITTADRPELEELGVTEDGVGLVEPSDTPTLTVNEQPLLEDPQPTATNDDTGATDNDKPGEKLMHSSSYRSLNSTTEQRQQAPSRTVSNNALPHPTSNNNQRSSLSNNPFLKLSIPSNRHLNQPQIALNRGLRSISTPIPRQSPFDSPAEIQAAKTANEGKPNTLLAQREHQIRNRYSSSSLNLNQNNPAPLAPVPELDIHPSDSISISDQRSIRVIDDDDISLSERKELLQQQTPPLRSVPPPNKLFTFDSHQPQRYSDTHVDPRRREAMLAQWRQSLRDESTGANTAPQVWAEAHRAERMRKGDMLDAHREAIRKMQAVANLHA